MEVVYDAATWQTHLCKEKEKSMKKSKIDMTD